MTAPLRESTDDELAAFERVCEQLAGFDDRLQAEWLDGYMTALLAGPRRVPADEWMPRVFGDAFDRAFADPPAVAEAHAALDARWKVIASRLDPERLLDEEDMIFLAPLIWSINDEERAKAVADGVVSAEDDAQWPGAGAEWAHGFLDAVDDFPQDWTPGGVDEALVALHDELLGHVLALTFALGSDDMADHLAAAYPEAAPTRDELIDTACAAIQELRVFWIDHTPRPPPRTVEKLPGRNDPCPCGSGKKFKKCHGAP